MFLSCISSLENYVMNHMNKQNGFTSFLPTKSIPISNSQGVYQTFIAKQLFIFQKASISRTKNVKIMYGKSGRNCSSGEKSQGLIWRHADCWYIRPLPYLHDHSHILQGVYDKFVSFLTKNCQLCLRQLECYSSKNLLKIFTKHLLSKCISRN